MVDFGNLVQHTVSTFIYSWLCSKMSQKETAMESVCTSSKCGIGCLGLN